MDIKAAKQISNTVTPAQGMAVGVTQSVASPPPASVPAAEASPPRIQPDVQRTLAEVAVRLREYLNSARRDLEFRVDQDANATVVIVRNASTGEVVRQIPNEEALRMLRFLNEGSATLLDLTA